MKVICPECASEYDVPVPMLGESGRRVRCAQCGHIWMADIHTEEDTSFGSFGRFDDNPDVEPIPASVHPSEDDVGYGHDGPGFLASLDKGYLGRLAAGFGFACLIFALLLGIGAAVGLNSGALRPIFVPFGLAGEPQKSPLILHDVAAKSGQDAAGQPILTINGRIKNTSSFTVKAPLVEITLLSQSGAEGDSIQVKPEQDKVEGDTDVKFTAEMSGGAAHGDQVRIKFIP